MKRRTSATRTEGRPDLAGAFSELLTAMGTDAVTSFDVEDYALLGANVQIVSAEPVAETAMPLSLIQADTWQLEAPAFRIESTDPETIWTMIAGVLVRGAGLYRPTIGSRRLFVGPHAVIAADWRNAHPHRPLVRVREWAPWVPPDTGEDLGLPNPDVMATWPRKLTTFLV